MSAAETAGGLQVRREGAIAWLTLNRPDVLNAVDLTMANELKTFFGDLCNDRETRVVILQGAGRAFCAGLDLKQLQSDDREPGPVSSSDIQDLFAEIILRMRRCPQPIISLLHGSASGLGFAMALASDVRYATPDARMNAAFIRIGLTACDVGVSYLLPKLVGSSIAAELLLTGRFLSAERALRCGLVSEIVDADALAATGQTLAAEMLLATPLGLRLTKEGLDANLAAPGLGHAILLENRQQILCAQTADFREAITAFNEKRAPRYKNA